MINDAEINFERLVAKFTKIKDVEPGIMMSAPAIEYRGRVFAFFYNNNMTFRLGLDFNPDEFGLVNWSHLSPFKNKAPMKAWYVTPYQNHKKWEILTQMALERMMGY